jgi:hypothetical protein
MHIALTIVLLIVIVGGTFMIWRGGVPSNKAPEGVRELKKQPELPAKP